MSTEDSIVYEVFFLFKFSVQKYIILVITYYHKENIHRQRIDIS